MRIGIDAQLALGTATGIGEYARGLIAALDRGGVDAVALSAARVDPWRFDRRVLWDQVLLPVAAARSRVDLIHCASGTMPLIATVPIVTTVHDVAWLRVQAHTRPYARAYFGSFALSRYAHARRILVDSHFSRDELLATAAVANVSLGPERIDVVYPGVAADVMAIERRRDNVAPYILAVGTVEARKNLAVLVRALARLPRLRLISVGPPTPYREACLALARELGVADRVDVRGYVARGDVLALYAGALVAAVPSRYEGFGYGAAQALCAGVPLVAAATTSLPEVAGAEAASLAPEDVEGWVDAIARIAAAPDDADAAAARRRAAACERFGWSTCALATVRAYALALTE